MAPIPPMIANSDWSPRSIPQLHLDYGEKCRAILCLLLLRCRVLKVKALDRAGSVEGDKFWGFTASKSSDEKDPVVERHTPAQVVCPRILQLHFCWWDISRLCSHWSSYYITALSLVESFIGIINNIFIVMLHQISYLLCLDISPVGTKVLLSLIHRKQVCES